jgi:hypothetical protein
VLVYPFSFFFFSFFLSEKSIDGNSPVDMSARL